MTVTTHAVERSSSTLHPSGDGPYLASQPLLALSVLPPVIMVLVADLGALPAVSNLSGCLTATWICTVVAGLALHATVNVVAPRALASRYPKSLAYLATFAAGAASVALTVLTLLPRLTFLTPHLVQIRAEYPALAARAVAIGALYVVAARAYTVVARRARRAVDRAREQERMALRARLEALQARTNPHFLFNTLNSIASLIPSEPELAEAMIERLAGVLQYSLTAGDRGSVALGEELSAVRDYLEIEQARFGPRLRARIEVAPELDAARVPPMLLQPLVENAVLHGLGGREQGGQIVVAGRSERDAMVFTVSDDGVGPGGSTRRGTQTGLTGVRERLALTYGEAASVVVRTRNGGGFECELRVPHGQPA